MATRKYTKGEGSVVGTEVIRDLADFCFINKSYIDTSKKLSTSQDGSKIIGVSNVDPLELARFEGRREVFLYIQGRLKLKYDDLEGIYDDEQDY